MDVITLDKEKVLKSFIENKDILEKRNAEGIEKYRKGDFTIKFANAGKKKITVKQKKHKFLFGCTAFMLNSFEKEEKEAIFKEKFVRLFNQAVVPFYWEDLEPQEGQVRFSKDSENIYRRPAPDIVLEFCKEYGIEPKGHCLTWNRSVPEWLQKYDVEQKKRILERRFKEIAEAYADKIPSFDIVNESASNYNFGRKSLFEGYDEYGLELGGKYFSKNIKILNETIGAIWKDYVRKGKYMAFNLQLKAFLDKGYPIDEIGLQYHVFGYAEDLGVNPFLNVENMLDILEIFNAYHLPMHISEITIPSYWGGNEVNEEIQATITEALYKTWFATEHMKSIVWWNLVDGYAAYAPIGTGEGENYYGGGLLHFDMSEKPAYKVLDRLINEEWKTSFEKCVDTQELSFRGFYGEYEITVDGKTYTVNLDENGKEVTL